MKKPVTKQYVRYVPVAVSIRATRQMTEGELSAMADAAISEAIWRSANHQANGIILRQPRDPNYPAPPALDHYTMGDNDQPTTCPKCGARTEWETVSKKVHLNTCPQCHYRFLMEEGK